jgi:hypothetical protein
VTQKENDARTVRLIAEANRLWARKRLCTRYAFAVGCYEHVNGVGISRQHGAYCAFGRRTSDGSRAESCFPTIAQARQHARRG